MGTFQRLFILILSISGIFSDTASRSIGTREVVNDELYSSNSRVRRADDDDNDDAGQSAECVLQCRVRYNRQCSNLNLPVPLACGECITGFLEKRYRDGLKMCQQSEQSRSVADPDQDIDRIADMIEARQGQGNSQNTGGQVKVVKNNNNNAHQDEINLRAEQHMTARQNNNSIYTGSVVPAPQVHSPPESHETEDEDDVKKFIVLAVVAGCSVAGVVGLIVAGVCWYRLQRNVKAASEAEYPAYGVTGPQQERIGSPGDRKLAQSAQMYHYQHQKQQMLAMEKANGDMTKDDEGDSEEENEEGDYTVYECPGLAPTGEMEVKNPLFTEETPVTPDASHEERK